MKAWFTILRQKPHAIMTLAVCILAACKGNEAPNGPAGVAKAGTRLEILRADSTGITFRNTIKEDDAANYFRYLYMYNGGGVAAGDVDGDGLPDLAFVSNRAGCALYKNLGDLRFKDVSAEAGFRLDSTWATGVSMADVNADGMLDIYVCASGPAHWPQETRRNKLFINLGGGKFKEEAKEAGLADEGFNTMAYFADLDRDEDLDCFIVSHRPDFQTLGAVLNGPHRPGVPEGSDRLYLNDGTGHFADHTAEAGLQSDHFGLSAALGDLNGDGLMDIYISDDFYTPDMMMINEGGRSPGEVPHFTDRATRLLKHTSYFSMGMDRADFNNDTEPDLYVVDMTPGDHRLSKENMASMAPGQFKAMVANGMHHQYMFNNLQLNNGDGTWSEMAQMAGVDRTDWSWAPLFADLDNDGWKDLFVTNGIKRDIANNDFRNKVRPYANAKASERPPLQDMLDLAPKHVPEKMIYRNNHDLTFSPAMDLWDCHHKSLSNGAAYADLDSDGDLDLVTVDVDAPATVIRNLTRENTGAGYFQLVLKGTTANPQAIGASATLYAASGPQKCELLPARGFQSSVEPILHFGMPDEKIDSVVIDWPDGQQTLLTSPQRDQRMVVDRSSLRPRLRTPAIASLFEEVSGELGLHLRHEENAFDDLAVETLLPQRQSDHGPGGAIADVDGDGLDDLLLTASAGSPCVLLLQNASGKFAPSGSQPWRKFKASEFIGAHFFDADGDKDPDLYLAAGSTEFPVGSDLYRDRLFVNDGKGGFATAENALPDARISSQAVASADIDSDGDLDLFVGGRNVPGQWPAPPPSQVLINNGHGIFSDGSAAWLGERAALGLVTDALFADVDSDNRPELLICGEWMSIHVLKSDGKRFTDISTTMLDTTLAGWWQSLSAGDIDGDGDLDLVAGNLGLNNKFHPSSEHPLVVYQSDFDGNKTNDIVLAKTGTDRELPVRGIQCSSLQMPFIKDKFHSFEAYANASLQDIYGQKGLAGARRLKATTFASMLLVNDGDHFTATLLPMTAQLGPVRSAVITDTDNDGYPDLLIAGGMYGTEAETGRYDAGMGLLLTRDAAHMLVAQPVLHSGFSVPYDTRHVLPINLAKMGPAFIALNNDGPLLVFARRRTGTR